jgi:hypothetical protein
LTNLTSNGFVKTSGSDGTLSVDTTSYQTVTRNVQGFGGTVSLDLERSGWIYRCAADGTLELPEISDPWNYQNTAYWFTVEKVRGVTLSIVPYQYASYVQRFSNGTDKGSMVSLNADEESSVTFRLRGWLNSTTWQYEAVWHIHSADGDWEVQ